MRCRFCDTEIADKALICYRCGRATTDPVVAPPPIARGLSGAVATGVIAVAAAAATAWSTVADGLAEWVGWGAAAAVAGLSSLLWWGGRVGRR